MYLLKQFQINKVWIWGVKKKNHHQTYWQILQTDSKPVQSCLLRLIKVKYRRKKLFTKNRKISNTVFPDFILRLRLRSSCISNLGHVTFSDILSQEKVHEIKKKRKMQFLHREIALAVCSFWLSLSVSRDLGFLWGHGSNIEKYLSILKKKKVLKYTFTQVLQHTSGAGYTANSWKMEAEK